MPEVSRAGIIARLQPAACIILPWRGFPTHGVVRCGFAGPGKCAPIRRHGRRSCLRAIDLSVAPLCGGNCDPLFAALLLPPPRNGVTRHPRSPRSPLPCFAYDRWDAPHRLGGVLRCFARSRLCAFAIAPQSTFSLLLRMRPLMHNAQIYETPRDRILR